MADPFCRRPPREMASSSPRARPTRWCGSGMPPPVVSWSGSPRIKGRSRGWRSCRTMPRLSRRQPMGRSGSGSRQPCGSSPATRGRLTPWSPTPSGVRSRRARPTSRPRFSDLNNGNLIRSLAGHSDAVRAVVVSGDGTRVVTAGNDRTVRFWNAGDGNNVLVLPGLPAPALSLAASSDSKLAAAGLELEDGSTRVSDLTATDAAKTELQTFTPGAGAGPIAAVAFLAEPLALLTGGGDRSLKLWTVIAPGAGRTLSGHGNQVYSAAWSPDGKRLATGAADKTVRQRDMVKMTQVRKLSERKLKMFPDDHRQIVSARVVMVGNAFRIEVASATLP